MFLSAGVAGRAGFTQIIAESADLPVGMGHFFMDFAEPPHGNQKDILNLEAYGDGSNYFFADGSARFIAKGGSSRSSTQSCATIRRATPTSTRS